MTMIITDVLDSRSFCHAFQLQFFLPRNQRVYDLFDPCKSELSYRRASPGNRHLDLVVATLEAVVAEAATAVAAGAATMNIRHTKHWESCL